ncbi:MAG: CDP-alcohol phosphatidyltransferase family protein [bacterium]|jgi:cardiolipin synthase|nr:CDP-alcohol phosphatidyltransferase family protein [bacterium]
MGITSAPVKKKSSILNLPNTLTGLRIVLTPLFLWLFHQGDSFKSAFALLCLIGLTDFLDGTVARYTGQVTRLGQILDPMADKFFLVSSMGVLAWEDSRLLLPVGIIIGRDILVIVTSFIFYLNGKIEQVQAHVLGKLAAALQVLGVVTAFITHAWRPDPGLAPIPFYLLSSAALFSIVSGTIYIVRSWTRPRHRSHLYSKEGFECQRSV